VGWIATNHPGRTRAWLHTGLRDTDREDVPRDPS